MKWTRQLPIKDGWYWYKDRDVLEHGIAFVRITANPVADILIAESNLDGGPFLSSAYWLPTETINCNWEWYGPIEEPK